MLILLDCLDRPPPSLSWQLLHISYYKMTYFNYKAPTSILAQSAFSMISIGALRPTKMLMIGKLLGNTNVLLLQLNIINAACVRHKHVAYYI